MRTTTSVLVCSILILSSGLCLSSPRLVVAELTTNTSCGPCFYANGTLDQIANTYEDYELAIIRYHCWWPSSSDPFYQYNISENTARVNYYGADYAPHLRVDGTVDGGSSYNTWNSLIASELTVDSPLEINLTGDYDPASRTGDIMIEVIATQTIGYSNLKLRIALTESNIRWTAPNGSTWHNQTFRDMIPGASGIALTINQGDTLNFQQSFTYPGALNYENCNLVVFIQSDNNHRVLQGAQIAVTDIEYTLSPFSLISPADDTVLANCNPYFIWQASNDADSGYAIEYQVSISQNPDFSSPLTSEILSDTSWYCPVCLPNEFTYYWRVLASNGHAPDRYSEEVFSFYLDEGEVIISPPAIDQLFLIADDVYETGLILFNDSYFNISYTLADSGDIISLEFESGDLDTFETDTVGVYLATAGLSPGVYDDTIFIATTHPVTDFRQVPVSFQIYVHGDANCDNLVIGSDVTYLVNYFRGVANPPCDPFLRADANGDCNVIGSDVTYMVNYFRGVTPPPSPGDCD